MNVEGRVVEGLCGVWGDEVHVHVRERERKRKRRRSDCHFEVGGWQTDITHKNDLCYTTYGVEFSLESTTQFD